MKGNARIVIVAGVAIALHRWVLPRVASALKVRAGAGNFLASLSSSLQNVFGEPGEPGLPASELE